jgi:hypothetical protein
MSQAIEEKIMLLHEDIEYDYFVAVAKRQGWIKYKTYPGDGGTERFEEVWTTQNKANAIHYIDDPISGTRFVWVRGSQLRELLFEIDGRLPTYEPEELIEMLDEADDNNELVDALFRLAVGFPSFDMRVFQIFEAYSSHQSALIREATVQAIAYRLWPESLELLRRISQQDSSDKDREFAKSILAQIDLT